MTQIQKQNVPKLRFPGFEGDWEAVPVSEKVTSIKSGRTKHAETGNVPVYGSTGLLGFTDKAEFEGQNLLVARVGANAGQLNRADGSYGVTDNTLVITPSDQIDLGFLEASLRLFNLNRLVFGSGQPLVTGTMLKRLKREFPTLPEQRKIAGFLSAVDEKITHLSRKKALLEDYKKGCMQQLFSQKIRFKDDDGNDFPEWEEKRLGEILNYEQPTKYLVASSEYADEHSTPVLTAGKTFILGYTDETHGIFTKLPVIIFDDFTTAFKFVDFPFKAKSSAMKMLTLADDVDDLHFVHAAMLQMKFQVGEHKRYWIAEYQKETIPYPHPTEQRKIADFLSALDRKIDLVAQELTHARSFKAGLLQQMFV